MPTIDPNNSEKDFHQDALNEAKKRNIHGRIVSDNEERGGLQETQARHGNDPRWKYPDKLLEDVQNRYKNF